MLKLASKLRISVVILFNVVLHIILKVLSVFIVGMFIGASDSGMKNVIYFELFFLLLHFSIILLMLQKKWLIRNRREFFGVVFLSVIFIGGLYYFNYLPPFGSG